MPPSRTNSHWAACLSLVAAVGCGGESAAPESMRVHEFPALELGPGDELSRVCQSWTLGNDEPLYVNAVAMSAGRGWHHSNWFYVDEESFSGPDGTWPCEERDFNAINAAVAGGVLYAQSTQATEEVQAFRPGAALMLPPHSKIVGDVHLLNASEDSYSSNIQIELRLLEFEAVKTQLLPLELHYFPLEIPPNRSSEFAGSCDYTEANGGLLDLEIHYVLPHYHDLGTGMTLEVMGGPKDGEQIFAGSSAIGEPLGKALEPPFELSGASGLRFGCSYQNPRDETVRWGIGDQEMCVALAFTDASVMWAGGVETQGAMVGEEDGVARYEGPCRTYFAPAP